MQVMQIVNFSNGRYKIKDKSKYSIVESLLFLGQKMPIDESGLQEQNWLDIL